MATENEHASMEWAAVVPDIVFHARSHLEVHAVYDTDEELATHHRRRHQLLAKGNQGIDNASICKCADSRSCCGIQLPHALDFE